MDKFGSRAVMLAIVLLGVSLACGDEPRAKTAAEAFAMLHKAPAVKRGEFDRLNDMLLWWCELEQNEGTIDEAIARAEAWAAAEPKAILALLALSDVYVVKSMEEAQASGGANQKWMMYVIKSDTSANRATDLEPNNPLPYARRLRVAATLGMTPEQFTAIFLKGNAADPEYLDMYSYMTFCLANHWADPAATVQFATQTADRLGGELGDMAYAQFARQFAGMRHGISALPGLGFAVERVKRGNASTIRRHPKSHRDLSLAAAFACAEGNRPEAQRLFEAVPDNRYDPTMWFDSDAAGWAYNWAMVPAPEGEERLLIQRQFSPVVGIVFLPDGRMVTAGHEPDAELQYWSVASGKPKLVKSIGLKPYEFIVKLAVLPGTSRLVLAGSAGNGALLRIWDPEADERPSDIAGHQAPVCSVAISPDKTLLASGDKIGTLRLQSLDGFGASVAIQRDSEILAMAFCADGKQLAVGTLHEGLTLHTVATGEIVRTVDAVRAPVNALQAVGDALYAGAAGDRPYKADIHANTGRFFGENTTKPGEFVSRLAIAGDTLMTSRRVTYSDQSSFVIGLYDRDSGKLRQEFSYQRAPINCLTIAPDGKTLVTGAVDGAIKFYDLPQPQKSGR